MIVDEVHCLLVRVFGCTEEYLLEAWPIVKGALKEQGVSCKLSLVR